jgi:membrane protease YdiL (CAAX protease family)
MTFSYSQFIASFSKKVIDRSVHPQEHLAQSSLALFPSLAVATLLLIRRRHWPLLRPGQWSWRRTLGFTAVLLVFLRLIATLLLGFGSGATEHKDVSEMALPWLTGGARTPEITEVFLALYREYGAAVLVLIAALVVPLYEEFIFRGIMLDSCERHLSFHLANILQALTFALLHQRPVLVPFFFMFGWVAGLMRRESGGLLVPILMHVSNNFLATLQFLATAS